MRSGFPSDPDTTVLESNDVAFLLRSDEREHVADAARSLFADTDGLFDLTSIRKGFQGGGFPAGPGCQSRWPPRPASRAPT